MPFTNLRRTISSVKDFNIAVEVREILEEASTQEYIIGLLQSQLKVGIDGDGKPVTVFGRDRYSNETVYRKSRISGTGGITEWITYYMSGNFYLFMKVKTSGTVFDIYSDVEYFEDIILMGGESIMRLNSESMQLLRNEVIIPLLKLRYENSLK